jgi:hypothetical protein
VRERTDKGAVRYAYANAAVRYAFANAPYHFLKWN